MKRSQAVVTAILLLALFPLRSLAQIPGQAAGHWEGELNIAGKSMPLVLDLHGTMFRYDAPVLGIYASNISKFNFSGDTLSFDIPGREPIHLEGTIVNEQMQGASTGSTPISFSVQRRSPQPNFYEEEEVSFISGMARISGTLIKPLHQQPNAAIVMIHGSANQGRMTRDKTRDMAMVFVQSGLAALIYDRRGNGTSTGESDRILEMKLLAADAAAGAEFLASRKDIRKKQIGFYGLSQGGWVAPYAASLFGKTAFVVTVSAAAVTPDEQDQLVQEHLSVQGSVATNEEIVPGFSKFDPLPYWHKLNMPVLAIWGEKDPIIPVEKSKQLISEALSRNGNHRYTMKIFPNANHEIKIKAGPLAMVAPGSTEFIQQWVREHITSR